MNIDDQILKLAVKKMANEASRHELNELDRLIKNKPEVHDQMQLIFDWWYHDHPREIDNSCYSLFKKILGRINEG